MDQSDDKPTKVQVDDEGITGEKGNISTEEEKTEIKVDEIKAEELKAEEHKAEELKAEEHKAEELKAEEHKGEELKAEEHKAEELKAEEHKAEELKAEEHKVGELKAEEHKAEEVAGKAICPMEVDELLVALDKAIAEIGDKDEKNAPKLKIDNENGWFHDIDFSRDIKDAANDVEEKDTEKMTEREEKDPKTF